MKRMRAQGKAGADRPKDLLGRWHRPVHEAPQGPQHWARRILDAAELIFSEAPLIEIKSSKEIVL
jgi:hypothetical protein